MQRRVISAPTKAHPSCAVVVTVHTAYLTFLEEAVRSVDMQNVGEKILAIDATVADMQNPSLSLFGTIRLLSQSGWRVIVNDFKCPNKNRNAAWSQVKSAWVIGWDADNVMPEGYVSSLMAIASGCSPDIGYISTDVEFNGMRPSQGRWTRDAMIARPVVDTSSAWRMAAVESVGFFTSSEIGYHDDYDLAVRITRQGWKGISTANLCISRRMHGDNRSMVSDGTGDAWKIWRFAFVTLWSGRSSVWSRVLDCLMTQELPPNSRFVWVINSQNEDLISRLNYAALRLSKRGIDVRIIMDDHQPKIVASDYMAIDRHVNVARLYNRALDGCSDECVVTVEDDMIFGAQDVKKLAGMIQPHGNVGCATSIYRARHSPRHICGARHPVMWDDCPAYAECSNDKFPLSFTGGGLAVWAGWCIREAIPFRVDINPMSGALMGWDGNLCQTIRNMGYGIMADGSIRARHVTEEVESYLRALSGSEVTVA